MSARGTPSRRSPRISSRRQKERQSHSEERKRATRATIGETETSIEEIVEKNVAISTSLSQSKSTANGSKLKSTDKKRKSTKPLAESNAEDESALLSMVSSLKASSKMSRNQGPAKAHLNSSSSANSKKKKRSRQQVVLKDSQKTSKSEIDSLIQRSKQHENVQLAYLVGDTNQKDIIYAPAVQSVDESNRLLDIELQDDEEDDEVGKDYISITVKPKNKRIVFPEEDVDDTVNAGLDNKFYTAGTAFEVDAATFAEQFLEGKTSTNPEQKRVSYLSMFKHRHRKD